MALVAKFAPSTSGFRFPNSFPHVPVRRIGIPGVVSVPIGDASNGLCGGMVFAVRDYFEAGRTPPSDTTAPGEGPVGRSVHGGRVEALITSGAAVWA